MNVTIRADYCGQEQPHPAHVWITPPVYGSATVTREHQCAGLSEPRPQTASDLTGG